MVTETGRPPAPGSLAAPITVAWSEDPPVGDPGVAAMRAAAAELAELAGLAALAAAIGGRVALAREHMHRDGPAARRWLASATVTAVGRASATVALRLYAAEDEAPELRGGGAAALVLIGPGGRPLPWPPELRASFAAWQADAEG